MSLTMHQPDLAVRTESVVRVIRTRNSIYIMVGMFGSDTASLTCVEGTFEGQRFDMDPWRSDVPHVGEAWRLMTTEGPLMTSTIEDIAVLG